MATRAASTAASALLTGAAAVLVGALAPRPADLPREPASVHGWLSWAEGQAPEETLAALGGLLACALAGWLAVAALATLAARLPGTVGRAADVAARVVTPAVLRRALAAGVGAAVATGPAAPAVADGGWRGLDWPAASTRSTTARPVAPARPAPAPPTDPVVVAPGDCLWTIAASFLPAGAADADIAAAWPRWYAANRAVLGTDPDLLLPGQRLTPPPWPSRPRPGRP